jgi:hypothetical protein
MSYKWEDFVVTPDFYKSAYWLLRAVERNHRLAFFFLHRFVPEYFMIEIPPEDILHYTEKAIKDLTS